MKKRLLILSCIAAMAMSCFAAPAAMADDNSEDYITITDMNGREAQVPKEIDSVVLTALPLPSIYALSGAPIEKLKGIHPGATSAIENSVMAAMYPEMVGIANNFVEGTELNVEELLKLDPDVVIYWAENENQYEALSSVGIPAVGVKGTEGRDVIETLRVWLDIMGQMFDTTDTTQRVIEYADETRNEVEEKLKDLSDEDKPKVLYLENHNKDQISVSGSNSCCGFWIESTGGINVAAGLDPLVDINMEQVYEWNPDIILITNFTDTMPEDIYNNVFEGQDWSNVAAVKNGKVFKTPLGVYRWTPPSGDAPLMFKWMAQTLHPELFDYDMEEEIIEYYQQFYDYALTEEQAEGILNAQPEAAKGATYRSGNPSTK